MRRSDIVACQETTVKLSGLFKRLLPATARSFLQPSILRNYRNRQSLREQNIDVVRPTEVIDCTLGRYTRVARHCWVASTKLGDHSYIAERATVAFCDIGKFCSIAPGCYVGLAQHPSRGFVSTHPAFYLAQPENMLLYADQNYFDGWTRTTIGNDVWIGSAAQIRSGITIGNGAIIGAGAVVTADVPAYAIVVGVPAKTLRYRFDEATVAFLEKFQWWDRDETWLAQNYKKFHDIQAFRTEFDMSA